MAGTGLLVADFVWLMAGTGLLVADLFWEKNTTGWWLIS
jgi:hypothetical protein